MPAPSNQELVEALMPFAQHVGKSGALVTLKIGNDTWTGTLETKHFEKAAKLVHRSLECSE